ncbi:MAG: MBL fold metallo-hydrolase [Deltaproteobacteria bacterium]|nr:MBL fold metallo-hydrolase [Deltaproteobacteria bacterium]
MRHLCYSMVFCLFLGMTLAACGDDQADPVDSGLEDAGLEDAGLDDAGPEDAGSEDAGLDDAGSEDAGSEDAGSEDAGLEDAGSEDAGSEDAGSEDAGSEDAGLEDAGEDAGSDDAGTDAGIDLESQLIIEQIGIDNMMGESALIVGPDGTSVIIDTGGGSYHHDEILGAVDRWLDARSVDWVILTHFHADHVGGFAGLFKPEGGSGSEAISVRRGVIHRGLYDLNGDFISNDSACRSMCEALADPAWNGKIFTLCEGAAPFSCDGEGAASPWPADDCSGLLLGDLEQLSDDEDGVLSYLSLGGNAYLTFFHANAHVATNAGVLSAEDEGLSVGWGGTGPENNRSLGGVVEWGQFRFSFHGDLSSQIEDYIEGYKDQLAPGPLGQILPEGSLDATKLSHHGLIGSTGDGWLDWLWPDDGHDRNALVGTNTGYFFSPSTQVMANLENLLGEGWIWVTHDGVVPGDNPRKRLLSSSAVIRVEEAGAVYEVFGLDGLGQPSLLESYASH